MTERMTATQLRAHAQWNKQGRGSPERHAHIAILEYLRTVFPEAVINHAPNEVSIPFPTWFPTEVMGTLRRVIASYLSRQKDLGMRPGWPDLEMIYRGAFWAFEVKAEGGYPTKEQKQVGAEIIAAGGRWAVVRSIDDVEECIEEWRDDLGLEVRGVVR